MKKNINAKIILYYFVINLVMFLLINKVESIILSCYFFNNNLNLCLYINEHFPFFIFGYVMISFLLLYLLPLLISKRLKLKFNKIFALIYFLCLLVLSFFSSRISYPLLAYNLLTSIFILFFPIISKHKY